MASNSQDTNKDNKLKALDIALSTIEKQFGKGAIMKLDPNEKRVKIPAISTGCLGIDLALGVGGVPKGRIIEVYGQNHQVKQHLPYTSQLSAKKKAEQLPLLMQNMHSIRHTPQN